MSSLLGRWSVWRRCAWPGNRGLRDGAAQPVVAPRAKEDGSIVNACHETAQSAENGAQCRQRGNTFLKAGQDKRLPDLDPPSIPKKLVVLINAEPPKVFKADLFDAGRPVQRFSATQGGRATNMASSRRWICSSLSTIFSIA
ncbi:hypothetical protein [Rhodopila sp.]|uniref:hypothetical protein n=1 Tax=Rhodopila sp. TaxID=2480087 RepID=UPI003D10AF1D